MRKTATIKPVVEWWRAKHAPEYPRRIIGGKGLVGPDGESVEIFRGQTESDILDAAFAASNFHDLITFVIFLAANKIEPVKWSAIAPGMKKPAEWFTLTIPRHALLTARDFPKRSGDQKFCWSAA